MIKVALFAALVAVGSFIRILIPVPFVTMPMTLQTLFVALSGIFLGPRLGPLSMTVYMAMGLAGLPIFSGGGGISYIFHPSFGFLLGFILGSYMSGKYLENKKRTLKNTAAAVLLCLIGLYGLGVPCLWANLNFIAGTKMSLPQAFKISCLVFLPGEAVKLVMATFLGSKVYSRLEERF